MVTRAQKIRLGVFLFVSIMILIIAVGLITGSQFFKKRDIYFIRFKDVSLTGLEIGSAVKYRGIRIGKIEDIFIDKQDITSIIVKISIKPDVPIKEDTEAVLTLIGITGLKMIELQGGTNEAEPLPPQSYITAGHSLVETISGRAEIITQKLEQILNNFAKFLEPTRRDQLFRLVDNTSKTLESFQTLLDTNQTNIHLTIQNFEKFSGRLDTFMVTSNLAMNDIRALTRSTELRSTIKNIEVVSSELEQANLSELIQKMSEALEQTNRTFTHLDLTLLKSRRDIIQSTEILRESLEYFNEFTRLISENPSLLLRSAPQKEIEER